MNVSSKQSMKTLTSQFAWLSQTSSGPSLECYHFSPAQCAEGVVTLIEDDKLNGAAIVISSAKGNFLHDKTRELEYAKVL